MKCLFIVIPLLFIASYSDAEELMFYDFSDLSNIQLNGEAANLNPNSNNVLSLTDDLWQSSSAFFTDSISLDNLASFSAAFEFQITDPQGISDIDGQGADGLTFVVQANTNTVGGVGGGIGYMGLDNSVAVELDTWRNSYVDGNDGNHVGINVDGDLNSIDLTALDTRMNNGAVWTVWVDYDGLQEVMEVRVSENSERPTDATVSASLDLYDTLGTTEAYIGFTSGTGAGGGDHDILSMVFYDDYSPVSSIVALPEPNTFVIFIVGLMYLVMRRIKQLKGK